MAQDKRRGCTTVALVPLFLQHHLDRPLHSLGTFYFLETIPDTASRSTDPKKCPPEMHGVSRQPTITEHIDDDEADEHDPHCTAP